MLVSYGPVMLHEALTAAELLAERGIEAAVVAMPWLDRVDDGWLAETFGGVRDVLVVEDHAPVGALGDTIRRALASLPEPPVLDVAGVEGWPACGTPDRGAAASRARRRDPRRSRRAGAPGSHGRVTAKPVWVVVADPLTARTFFDCGIMERLVARLGDRLRVAFTFRRADAEEWAARLPAGVPTFHADELAPDAVPFPERVVRRADRWLDERIGYFPLAIRLNLRHGFHGERMLPGHRNQLLDSSRVGPLPLRPGVERSMRRWHFSPRRHVASALRRRLEAERPDLVLSNLQMQSATPFIVLGRRLGLRTVGYVASWDHTVGKGVIWDGLGALRRAERPDARRPRALPRRRHRADRRDRLAAGGRLPRAAATCGVRRRAPAVRSRPRAARGRW